MAATFSSSNEIKTTSTTTKATERETVSHDKACGDDIDEKSSEKSSDERNFSASYSIKLMTSPNKNSTSVLPCIHALIDSRWCDGTYTPSCSKQEHRMGRLSFRDPKVHINLRNVGGVDLGYSNRVWPMLPGETIVNEKCCMVLHARPGSYFIKKSWLEDKTTTRLSSVQLRLQTPIELELWWTMYLRFLHDHGHTLTRLPHVRIRPVEQAHIYEVAQRIKEATHKNENEIDSETYRYPQAWICNFQSRNKTSDEEEDTSEKKDEKEDENNTSGGGGSGSCGQQTSMPMYDPQTKGDGKYDPAMYYMALTICDTSCRLELGVLGNEFSNLDSFVKLDKRVLGIELDIDTNVNEDVPFSFFIYHRKWNNKICKTKVSRRTLEDRAEVLFSIEQYLKDEFQCSLQHTRIFHSDVLKKTSITNKTVRINKCAAMTTVCALVLSCIFLTITLLMLFGSKSRVSAFPNMTDATTNAIKNNTSSSPATTATTPNTTYNTTPNTTTNNPTQLINERKTQLQVHLYVNQLLVNLSDNIATKIGATHLTEINTITINTTAVSAEHAIVMVDRIKMFAEIIAIDHTRHFSSISAHNVSREYGRREMEWGYINAFYIKRNKWSNSLGNIMTYDTVYTAHVAHLHVFPSSPYQPHIIVLATTVKNTNATTRDTYPTESHFHVIGPESDSLIQDASHIADQRVYLGLETLVYKGVYDVYSSGENSNAMIFSQTSKLRAILQNPYFPTVRHLTIECSLSLTNKPRALYNAHTHALVLYSSCFCTPNNCISPLVDLAHYVLSQLNLLNHTTVSLFDTVSFFAH